MAGNLSEAPSLTSDVVIPPVELGVARPVLTFLDEDPEVILYTLMELDAQARDDQREAEGSGEGSASVSRQDSGGDERRKPDYCPC